VDSWLFYSVAMTDALRPLKSLNVSDQYF